MIDVTLTAEYYYFIDDWRNYGNKQKAKRRKI